jgi:hypothetical protein
MRAKSEQLAPPQVAAGALQIIFLFRRIIIHGNQEKFPSDRARNSLSWKILQTTLLF